MTGKPWSPFLGQFFEVLPHGQEAEWRGSQVSLLAGIDLSTWHDARYLWGAHPHYVTDAGRIDPSRLRKAL